MYNAYLNLVNGDKQEFNINVSEKKLGNVRAVYIEAHAKVFFYKKGNFTLDPDFGAGIDFEIEGAKRWVADYRCNEFWCKPQFGKELKDVPDETQGLVVEKEDGNYCVVLPVVSEKYKCVLCGNENGKLTARLFSWYDKLCSCNALAFVIAEGANPYELLEECTKAALELLNNGCRTREERRYPEIFEYLGWCSWDAFAIGVSEEKLLKKCEEFKEKNIPVKWAILDDMWADVKAFESISYNSKNDMFNLMHAGKLYSFKAAPKRFPNGLKGCIDKIKQYGITVGVWHPTTGYWRGIDEDGEIYEKYKDCIILADSGEYVPDYKQTKSYEFYNAFHTYIRQCGADFVKIDNQSMARRFYKNLDSVGSVSRQFHNGMEASVGQHFDNCMINCMGMASEDMWNRSVSPLSRCSDDFQPENREWFTKHIMQCSYNCLVQGQLYYCDWDMWWTDDAQAVKNSIIRAISGGPIYVSDEYERSRREVLMPLILEDGKILRCDRPGMPTRDSLTSDPQTSGKIFKIQNICGSSGVIAVFNLDADDSCVTGTISPKDIEGIVGDRFVVYEHFSREYKIVDAEEKFEIQLKDGDEFRLYVVVPIENGFAPIGRIDKFISPKTIESVHDGKIKLVEDGPYAYVQDDKLVIKD